MKHLNKDHSIQNPKVLLTNLNSELSYLLAQEFATNGFELFTINKNIEKNYLNLKFHSVELQEIEKISFDILILNEGKEVCGPFLETDFNKEELFLYESLIENLKTLKIVLKKMKERNHGKILFFSSPGPYLEPCYEAITGAYRSFVYSFISGLRKELNETEIQITDLLPFLNDLIHFEKIDFIRSPEKFSVEIFNAIMSGKKHIIEPHLTHKFENFFKNTLFDYPSKFFLN